MRNWIKEKSLYKLLGLNVMIFSGFREEIIFKNNTTSIYQNQNLETEIIIKH